MLLQLQALPNSFGNPVGLKNFKTLLPWDKLESNHHLRGCCGICPGIKSFIAHGAPWSPRQQVQLPTSPVSYCATARLPRQLVRDLFSGSLFASTHSLKSKFVQEFSDFFFLPFSGKSMGVEEKKPHRARMVTENQEILPSIVWFLISYHLI